MTLMMGNGHGGGGVGRQGRLPACDAEVEEVEVEHRSCKANCQYQ